MKELEVFSRTRPHEQYTQVILNWTEMLAQKALVGVFWDIENCSVPKNKSAAGVVNHIRNTFIVNRFNHREYEFLVACDVSKIRKDIIEDLNRAGAVTLAHVSGTNKNAADAKIRESMRRFVDMHALMAAAVPTPPMLVLISGDIDFVHDIRGYKTRLGSTVILIHNDNCCEHFKLGWNEVYAFNDFCWDLANIEKTSNDEWLWREATTSMAAEIALINSRQPQKAKNRISGAQRSASTNDLCIYSPNYYYDPVQSEKEENWFDEPEPEQNTRITGEYILMVSGLPRKYNFRVLKAKLQEQADTVNGYVKFVKNGQGFISLKSTEDANEAGYLFDGYKFFGKKLNAEFVNSIPFKSRIPKATEQQESESETESESAENQYGYDEEVELDWMDEPETEQQITSNVEHLVMVSGLPGTRDFRIIKKELQEQADMVNGWVKFVKNGQAFISLKSGEDANAALALFHEFERYGKTLKCEFVNHIPFEPRKRQ